MLRIIRSNAVECLLIHLARRLGAKPLASPFTPEVVVVPSPAMGRWVNLQLARAHGVAANVTYPLPASFVWQLAHALLDDLPERDPLDLDAMAWKVFALLPRMLAEPGCDPLRGYLRDDSQGLKRWQLARRIADAFDRYQFYRPEVIRGWGEGDGEDWQALLWRRLSADIGSGHRVAVIRRLLGTLNGQGPFPALPERISLFAVSSLPPLFVEVIHAVAAHTAIHLYLHAPTPEFWADLVSQKEQARGRLAKPEAADLWEVGNSLLASWGRQGQALHDLLLSQEIPMEEDDAFISPGEGTLLQRLQGDIYALRSIAPENERTEVAMEDSVQVRICHSPLRECQVLHDQLLAMLEAEPELRPEDILVMIPEISLYAPYVEAVFSQDADHERPFIPWNLSDISLTDEHPLVQVFLRLLALPESRFSQSEVLSYMDVPELARSFGLDAEAVVQVKAWLAEANLRWGLDGAHKERLGLPATEENTWAQAEKRLFAGYALGDSGLFAGVAPVGSVEGSGAAVLGGFWRLLGRLTETAQGLGAARSAAGWQAAVGKLLTDCFGERDDEEGRIQKIREAVSDLADQAAAVDEPLAPALVRRWLEQCLGAEGRRGRYFSGGVTFCGMRPMRTLPFKVICVLGLQEQAFPRRDRLAEFDLMRRSWRPGDPRKGDEDRYLFLETLLCARRRLYLSYVGRDIRKNTERQPSVLVQELLDYLDQQYRPIGGDAKDRLSERLTRVHPLQPFSPRAFAGGAESYDGYWCEVARALLPVGGSAGEELQLWPQGRLSAAPEPMREVGLRQLERFLRHPVRYFVNSRLGVYLGEEEAEEDDERFGLDHLQSFLLKQRLVEDDLQGRPPSRERLSAEGVLPHGAFAGLALDGERAKVAPLLASLEHYRNRRPEQIAVDLPFGDREGPGRLFGQIRGIYPGLGLLRWRPSSLKGADILGLWLAHLAWCASGAPGTKRSAHHGSDGSFAITRTLAPEAAHEALADYLALYWEGVHQPLPVLPKASYAYAVKCHTGGKVDPMNAAGNSWQGSSFNGIPGDKDDSYIRFVMRGTAGDPLASADFTRLAHAFYDQALQIGELEQ